MSLAITIALCLLVAIAAEGYVFHSREKTKRHSKGKSHEKR